jgi:hypothetical protein
MLLERLNCAQDDFAALRELHLPNHVPPALVFDPVLPGTQFESIRRPAKISPIQRPKISTVPQNVEI